jgi:hypothetical protein
MKEAISRRPVLWAFVAFCATFVVSLPINRVIMTKYFVEPSRAFDLNFYLNIASRGYESPNETAFYPLWPVVISALHGILSEDFFVQSANLLSLIMFFVSLRIIWSFAIQLTNRETANWAVFLFALNPNSIFHGIAYPESLFSLLSALCLLMSLKFFSGPSMRTGLSLFSVTALMSASRPILLQLLAAGVGSIVTTLILFRHQENITSFRRTSLRWLSITGSATALGYAPYGYYCWQKFGNFFQPFSAQSAWDRKFGFYWTLITNPVSVSSSDNILTWDIQAFYLPSLLIVLFLFHKSRNESLMQNKESPVTLNTSDPSRSFLIVFCLMVAAAHSAIAFLTYPIFMSLARHVFSTPLFFIGATAVIHDIIPAKPRKKILGFYILVSVLYLVNFWTRFGKSSWMG